MLERFSRQRNHSLFRARSLDRDALSDRKRVETISHAIDQSLKEARAEQDGLRKRVDRFMASAAVALGNDTDEYLTRDAAANRTLGECEREILAGEERLKQLSHSIAQLESLANFVAITFPNFKPSPGSGNEKP